MVLALPRECVVDSEVGSLPMYTAYPMIDTIACMHKVSPRTAYRSEMIAIGMHTKKSKRLI